MLQLQKNPMAKGVLPGLYVSRQGVAHDAKSGYRSNSETTDKAHLKPVCFSVVSAASVFRLFHHPIAFSEQLTTDKVTRKGENTMYKTFSMELAGRTSKL